MAKKSAKSTGGKRTPSNKPRGTGRTKADAATGRRTAGARTPAGKRRASASSGAKPAKKGTSGARSAKKGTGRAGRAAKSATNPARNTSARKTAAPGATGSGSSRSASGSRKTAAGRKGARRGGTGREQELAQTPETGRTVQGPTNPMPTRRSTGTPAGAGSMGRAPGLERSRRELRELEESVTGPPSSLDLDRRASAARSGREELREARREHTETGPVLTGGDVDADWGDAYAVGDEAPGGDNPTPDQDIVEDIGRAIGVTYDDNEELKAVDKIAERDRHRWELDPASSEDYRTRDKDVDE